MSTDATPSTPTPSDLATGAWRLDPAHSSIEFHVPHFWGLITVKAISSATKGRSTSKPSRLSS